MQKWKGRVGRGWNLLVSTLSVSDGCRLLPRRDSLLSLQWEIFLVRPGHEITVHMFRVMMNSFKQQVKTLDITQLQSVITADKYKI